MALNEQEILRGVNQKDLKAWETLYASYYAALCSYADGIVKDSDTAQDIVQDTLISGKVRSEFQILIKVS